MIHKYSSPTHAPLVLKMARPDEVLCFAKNAEGATDIVRGSEHPLLRDGQKSFDMDLLLATGRLRMNAGVERKELIVLAADLDIENAIRGLLAQPSRLKVKTPSFDIRRHPNRDPGCRTNAADLLRPALGKYRHALVIFDHDGCGSRLSREEIQAEVDRQLTKSGWEQSKTIAVEPEIEAWVWSDSPQMLQALGWQGTYPELKEFLNDKGLWPVQELKPPDPKRAMLETMRAMRVKRSSRIFSRLAETANVRDCQDPAFNELLRTLRAWFPPQPRTARRGPRR